MIDRDKVLKGLECCLVFGEDLLYKCDECPYRATEDERKVIDWRCHLEELRKDTLELLKMEHPRCKDCLHYHKEIPGNVGYCEVHERRFFGKIDYCSYHTEV